MTAEPTSVELAEGFVLHLSVSQYNYVQRLQASLAALGFQLEPFGKETVLVRAVPTMLHTLLRLGNLLEAFQEAMQRSTSQSSPEEEREHLAAALACRTAIRAGDPLSTAQMASLVEAVTHQRLAYACPHGRPTHVTLSLAELERRFLLTSSPTERGQGEKVMLDPLRRIPRRGSRQCHQQHPASPGQEMESRSSRDAAPASPGTLLPGCPGSPGPGRCHAPRCTSHAGSVHQRTGGHRRACQAGAGPHSDLDTLVESFVEVTARHALPPMDVKARLAASVEAFVQVAEQEAELVTIMQTAHLREPPRASGHGA